MGIFSLPSKPEAEMAPIDYVECALRNIDLWKEYQNQGADYLLTSFAIPMLQKAAIVKDKGNARC